MSDLSDHPGEPPSSEPPSARTRVRRHPERAAYDRSTVAAVLDAGSVCHLGFTGEGGPVVIPTVYGRDGDRLYLHGAPASGFVRGLQGAPVCVTVTHVDGLVLSRSAFHHSVNFRSVVMFGRAELVADEDAKRRALECIVDHVLAGRSAEVRPPTAKELRGTAVLELPIDEASAKVRTGDPVEDEADLRDEPWTSTWAGVLPLGLVPTGPARPDRFVPAGTPLPPSVVAALAARPA